MANKRAFKGENPALSFVTLPEEPQEPQKPMKTTDTETKTTDTEIKAAATGIKPPDGYKQNPRFIETKNKRVQLLVQPSTLDQAKRIAAKLEISLNEAFNEAMKEYIKNHR